MATAAGVDYYTRIHLEEVNLHGDPAIRLYHFEKPDYVVEDPMVRISPNIISVADNNFNVKINMLNIGRAVNDSIWILVKRQLPNDTVRVLYHQLVRGIRNRDSLNITVPINPTTDKGLNKITVTLDETNRTDELFENNNSVTKEFYVFEDELRPSFPYNYSIINQSPITFVASTANPLSGDRQVCDGSRHNGIIQFTIQENLQYQWPGWCCSVHPEQYHIHR